MVGGTSHMESFDPKPELNRYSGKTFKETPYPEVVNSPFLNLRQVKNPVDRRLPPPAHGVAPYGFDPRRSPLRCAVRPRRPDG